MNDVPSNEFHTKKTTLLFIPDFTSPSKTAPFATDAQTTAETETELTVYANDMSAEKRAQTIDARQRELQQRIHNHTAKIQQQRSAALEMPPDQAIEMAKHNLDTVSHCCNNQEAQYLNIELPASLATVSYFSLNLIESSRPTLNYVNFMKLPESTASLHSPVTVSTHFCTHDEKQDTTKK